MDGDPLLSGSRWFRYWLAVVDGAGLGRVRPALNGGFGHQHRIGDAFMLNRRFGAAEACSAEHQDQPADVPEFPRHVSLLAAFIRGDVWLRNSNPRSTFR